MNYKTRQKRCMNDDAEKVLNAFPIKKNLQ